MSVTRKASLAIAALFLLITVVWPIAGQPPVAHADGGTLPDQPLRGMQIQYNVTGATLGTPETVGEGRGRVYENGTITGQVLTVSGTVSGPAAFTGPTKDYPAAMPCEGHLTVKIINDEDDPIVFDKVGVRGQSFNQAFSLSAKIRPDSRQYFLSIDLTMDCKPPSPGPTGLWVEAHLFPGASAIPSPTATSTPTAQRTIKGKVYAKDLASVNARDTLPIAGAKVTLLQNNKELAQTISDKTDGSFTLRAPVSEGLTINVSLGLAVSQPSPFVVVYGQSLEPASVASKPFDLTRNSPDPVTMDLVLGDAQTTIPGRGIPANRMNDLGAIYYYIYRSWETATTRLSQTLDYDLPLYVRAFGPCGNGGDSAFWTPSGSPSGLPDHPTICLDDANSNAVRRDFTFNVAHESGHHVMADSFGNDLPPLDSASKNHGGFRNPTSLDSWKEGFATFYAALVQKELLKKPRPELLPWGNNTINLEVNYSAWLAWGSSPLEEFAVASLLWDLVDPVDASDSTSMKAMLKDENGAPWPQSFGITLTAPIAVEKPTVQYADRVQMDLAKFWTSFTKDNSGVDPSPEAPSGFRYIYDMRQLYSVLKANGVGADQTPNKMTALDELFIAHGYFADTTPQNLIYDSGEAVGFTNNLPLAVNGMLIRIVNDVTYQNGPQVQQPIDLRVILVNGQWLIDGE